jgi:hypothetical protein
MMLSAMGVTPAETVDSVKKNTAARALRDGAGLRAVEGTDRAVAAGYRMSDVLAVSTCGR